MVIRKVLPSECEQGRSDSWPKYLLTALLLVCFQSLPIDAHADKYRAFYYDASSLLIQVEDVPDWQLRGRVLLDADTPQLPFPMLTKSVYPLLTGNKIPMSKFATIAVYYGFDESQGAPGDGTPNVRVSPKKIEYLGTVANRILGVCLARDSTDPCLFPKRCHCSGGTCCCY